MRGILAVDRVERSKRREEWNFWRGWIGKKESVRWLLVPLKTSCFADS